MLRLASTSVVSCASGFATTASSSGWPLNLAPFPVGLSIFGMAVARSMQIAQRVGVFAELAATQATAGDVARRLGLREQRTRRLLDVLVAAGHLRLKRGERYGLAPRAAKWLDPRSGRYVGDFIADTAGFSDWWGELEPLIRDGRSVEMHDRPAGDTFWPPTSWARTSLRGLASMRGRSAALTNALRGGCRINRSANRRVKWSRDNGARPAADDALRWDEPVKIDHSV